MRNKLVVNMYANTNSFGDVLKKTLENATRVDIAVSYLQMSGWHLLKKHFANLQPDNIRVLTTDQLGITHPAVLSDAVRTGMQVKSYSGENLYHPKVYLAYGSNEKPTRAVVGSANVSGSGFETGIEAGIEVKDAALVRELQRWFDHLFADRRAKCVDQNFIRAYEARWKSSSANRIRFRRLFMQLHKATKPSKTPTTEDFDVLDDAFSTIRLPVATLGFDQAGNNIRNLRRLLEVLSRFPQVGDKERSELHLLGFLNGMGLTRLGLRARGARSEREIARHWCRWIRTTSEKTLAERNPRLISFRRAANRFWELRPDVRQYFLTNITSTAARSVLQTIELLCNGSAAVQNLSFEDFRSLSKLVLNVVSLPEFIAQAVSDYLANKGSRSWTNSDRRVVLESYGRTPMDRS
jgi:HKD family nuclease